MNYEIKTPIINEITATLPREVENNELLSSEKRLLQSENQSLKLNQVFFHHFIFLYPKEKPNFIGIRTTYISLIL